MNHQLAGKFFANALRYVAGRQFKTWWPTQPETTALGWSIAFSWTKHALGKRQVNYWTTWGQQRHWRVKESIRKAHGIKASSLREGQYMLDFAVLPTKPEQRCHRAPLLTMESEAYGRHFVSKQDEGDYAWDFLKLLWVRSPRRVFIARVGSRAGSSAAGRIRTLAAELNEFVSHNQQCVIEGDEMAVFLLGANVRARKDSLVGVLTHGELRWEALDSVLA